MVLLSFSDIESNLPKISLLTSILLLFDVVAFLAITLNVEILHRWIGSWKDLLIWAFMNSSLLSFPIVYDDKRNSVVLLFNGTPELEQTNSSFSRKHQKDLCTHSSMCSLLPVQIPLSWEFVMDDRVYKYYCLHPNHPNHTVFFACSEQFKHHFVTDSLFVLNAFIPPDIFASRFMVYSPLWSIAMRREYLSCPCKSSFFQHFF